MEKELKEKGRELIDEIFPLSNECAPIADPNYPKRQGFVRGFKEALKLVKNNGVLDDVKETFDEAKMKRIVPHYIVGLGDKLLCNELRFIITDFLNKNECYKKEVERLNSL